MATSRSAAAGIGGIAVPRFGSPAAGLVLVAAAAWVVTRPLGDYPGLAHFHAQALNALPNVLAPLVVIALFIERAVEVVVTAWRGEEGKERKARLRRQLRLEAAGEPADPWAARAGLDRYRAETQRVAFVTAIGISVLVALMGIRAVEMLVQPGAVAEGFPMWQRSMFFWTDVSLTALLLAGGADGIHRVVQTFTSFLESTRERTEAAAVAAGAAADAAGAAALRARGPGEAGEDGDD
jgi:hypothetical protein